MNQTRLFLIKFLALVFMIMVVIGMPILLIKPDATGYFQAGITKLELLKTVPSPRIIVVGGSNVAFGVDGEMLEAAFGLPVINTGLHGGLGRAAYNEVSEYIRPGDIILLMPEYYIFWDKEVLNGTEVVIAQWMEYDLRRVRYVEFHQLPSIILGIAQIRTSRLAADRFGGLESSRGVYLNKNFNRQGDFIGHANITTPSKNLTRESYIPSRFFYQSGFDFLEQFNLDAKAKGAIVYFEFPASRATNCRTTGMDKIERLYNAILEQTTIPVLTPLDQICMPDSYFFDTIYHLNGVGRKIMTQRLVDDLLPLLP